MPMMKALSQVLRAQPLLEFAVLIGSQAKGTAQAHSDWDIALQWKHGLAWLDVLGHTEVLRAQLAKALALSSDRIDLIDLQRANLAMRAAVAEEGVPLLGEETLAWAHFLTRTWRELEDHYWEQSHAA